MYYCYYYYYYDNTTLHFTSTYGLSHLTQCVIFHIYIFCGEYLAQIIFSYRYIDFFLLFIFPYIFPTY